MAAFALHFREFSLGEDVSGHSFMYCVEFADPLRGKFFFLSEIGLNRMHEAQPPDAFRHLPAVLER